MIKCDWPGCAATTDEGEPKGWEHCVLIPPKRSQGTLCPEHTREIERLMWSGEIAPLSEDEATMRRGNRTLH
jgi:hypothetical protein